MRDQWTQTYSADVLFIDDNLVPESGELLRQFSLPRGYVEIVPAASVQRLSEDGQYNYTRSERTHHWAEAAIWKVAAFKDLILSRALEREYDFVFLVDSDLVLNPVTIVHLIQAEKDIVSEIFWTKWKPNEIELPQVWVSDQYRLYHQQRGEKLTEEEVSRRTAEFLVQLRAPGIYPVGGLGACTLISRTALQKGVSYSEIPNVGFWGEDRHFCIRAAALGLQLWVDTHFPCYHIYRRSDLAGVGLYRAAAERLAERYAAEWVARRGLEEWGTISWDTMTGWEGYDWFSDTLKHRRGGELARLLAEAKAGRSQVITRVVSAEYRGAMALPDGSRAHSVHVSLVNMGSEDGQAFCDALSADTTVECTASGDYVISRVEFRGDGDRRPAQQLVFGTDGWGRKASGNKLVLAMIVRNESQGVLRQLLRTVSGCIDEAVIVDDASTDGTAELCREMLQEVPLAIFQNPSSMFHQEYKLRMLAWDLVRSTDPNWILFLDADEVPEDSFAKEVRSLIDQVEYDWIAFRLYDMWDEIHYRSDSLWTAHTRYWPLLLRYLPGFPYVWRETNQHCGRMPMNALSLPGLRSHLRVKHFGWADPGRRKVKYERYLQLDPDGRYGNTDQYGSILDPHPNLVAWEDSERVVDGIDRTVQREAVVSV